MELWDPWECARAEGVRVYWADLAWPYRGRYGWVPGRRPRIVLARGMDEVEARCVLAEELGHHVRCSHLYPLGAARDPAARLTYSVAEAKAMRWAVNRLMPAEEVGVQLASGARPHELLDLWRVTWPVVHYRLQTMPEPCTLTVLRTA